MWRVRNRLVSVTCDQRQPGAEVQIDLEKENMEEVAITQDKRERCHYNLCWSKLHTCLVLSEICCSTCSTILPKEGLLEGSGSQHDCMISYLIGNNKTWFKRSTRGRRSKCHHCFLGLIENTRSSPHSINVILSTTERKIFRILTCFKMLPSNVT